jgi:hypothetical protein
MIIGHEVFSQMDDVPWWRELIARVAEVSDDEFEERTEELSSMLEFAFELQRNGLANKQATKLLTDALNQVKRWLSEPENVGNPAGHFVAAHLNGFLGLSPLNLANITRPQPKYLPIAMDVPSGGTFTKNDGSCLLVIPGIMASIYMVDSLSAPTLGMLAERGEDGLKKYLLDSGIATSKAARMVRDAKAAMTNTRVVITPVSLGECSGKKYSYYMAVQRVHHYCLSLGDRNILLTATEFNGNESALNVLERTIATIRIEPG